MKLYLVGKAFLVVQLGHSEKYAVVDYPSVALPGKQNAKHRMPILGAVVCELVATHVFDTAHNLGILLSKGKDMQKTCSKCRIKKPITEFNKRSANKDGHCGQCKQCASEYNKIHHKVNSKRIAVRKKIYRIANKEELAIKNKVYRENNKEKIAARGKVYREANKERTAAKNKRWYKDNKEKISARNKAHYEKNKEKIDIRNKTWNKNNKERIIEYGKIWRETNKERTAIRRKIWREINKEKISAKDKIYRKANRSRCRIAWQRRQARKRSLLDTFTHVQWQFCLDYFNNCCVYCGIQSDNLTMDHYIPLSDPECEGTTIRTIVPACGSCNSSKCNILPEIWIERNFPDQATAILKAVQDYFQGVK